MALTEQEEFELLSLEREKSMGGGQQIQEQPQQQNILKPESENVIDKKDLLGALLLGGAGVAGYSAYQGGLVPKVQENYQMNLQKQQTIDVLKGLQSQLGIQGTEAEFIPKKISELKSTYKADVKLQENAIKYQSELALNNAKTALEDFDNKILSSKVENLSSTLEENYPKFLRSASEGYSTGMKAIEEFLEFKGVKFDSLQFQKGFIDKTISEGMSRGLSESELLPLIQLRNQVSPKIDAQGMLAPENKLSFSQMKGSVSSIVKQNPQGRLSAVVNKNWIDFLDNSMPQDISPAIKGQLSKINSGYKQFAEARFQYSKIISPAGEFNRKASNKYLIDYFKSNMDDGTKQMMGFISKGNEIVSGIEGIESKFNELSELKQPRTNLSKQIMITKQLKQEALNKLSNDSLKTITKYNQMTSKYNEFISKLRVQEEKTIGNKLMFIPKAIKMLGRMGKIAGTSLAIAGPILDAMKYAQDPEGYLYQMETGNQLMPKGTMERKIQTGEII